MKQLGASTSADQTPLSCTSCCAAEHATAAEIINSSDCGVAIVFVQLLFSHSSLAALHDTMPNGDIGRHALQLHNIYYNEEIYQAPGVSTPSTDGPLPDHVDAVREALLSFDGTIPEEWEKDLREELDEFGDADCGPTWAHYPQDVAFIHVQHNERAFQERSAEHIIAHNNLKWFQATAKRARQLLEEPEPEWSLFWRSEVFMLFSDEARKRFQVSRIFLLELNQVIVAC
jgi:hypothetical protein